ncbi:MAG: SDR family oxidoreductase [Paludibacteraceae bacterium]|nr:SDR family oxidoreductase [Paludibacteraceae bacterium]MBR6043212.1 SDR family oxidoreductase [Paludibacteraceae bacterium]MBR6105997.1 SDR family oxidoreductase [Paludibacteraceae bacterium]MCR5568962.1 SDR family oxidoreductase [Paludibacteraceae bacterium]
MIDVKGKWALITGASRGIGYLSALFMAKQGCNLVIHSRSMEHSQKVVDEVKALGVKAYAVAAELSELDQVATMLAEVDKLGVQIDIVLNNAGLQIAYRTEFYNTPMSDYMVSYKINTMAPAMICYHFLPMMQKRGFGRIVNTTSGIRLEPEQAGYSASKAALDKITIDLGSKLNGSDVMINLADPGWCRTDLGGPKAPNSPESAIPGVLVGAFANDKKCGRIFSAQDYAGMSLADAVAKAESVAAPY